MSDDFDFELAQILRQQAPGDESLHSIMLRALLTYNPHAKPIGIIGHAGYWIDAPFIQKEYEHLFYRYPDHHLLETIDITLSITGRGNNLFSDPTKYADRIKSTFFSGRKTRDRASSRKKVKYCLRCIEESIEEYGYGYFRYIWDFSSICLIHNYPLKELPELTFHKSLKVIKKLLQGRDFSGAITLELKPNEKLVHSLPNTENRHEKYFYPIKIAACAKRTFAYWVAKNRNDFIDHELADLAEKLTRRFFQPSSVSDYDYQEGYTAIFHHCANFEAKLLKSFFEQDMEFIKVDIGARKQGAMKEVFAKNNKLDCDSCELDSCFMKKKPPFSVINPSDLDYQYLLDNSYSVKRLAMQFTPIARIGKDVWSPIDVFPELDGEQEVTEYKLRLGSHKSSS